MRSFIVAALLLLTAIPAAAQGQLHWEWRNPMPQGNALNDVAFSDEKTATVVGDFGAILRTTDGGDTWAQLPRDILWNDSMNSVDIGRRKLEQVWFGEEKNGVILGDYGTRYATVDDGATWRPMHNKSYFYPTRFAFHGRTGIAAGGAIARSTDGGTTWKDQPTSFFLSLSCIAYAGQGIWIAGGSEAQIARSTDDGITWNNTDLPSSQRFTDLWFRDDGTGVMVGDAIVARTTDRGVTWTTTDDAATVMMTSLAFLDDRTGVAVGAGSVIRTTDAGATWTSIAVTKNTLNKITVTGRDTMIAVGALGTILRSSDRGTTWSVIPGSTKQDLVALSFADEQTGLAVGANGTIIRTRDGGRTWDDVAPGVRSALGNTSFVDDRHGVTLGLDNTVLRTADGGETWNASHVDRTLTAAAFLDTNHGFGIAGSYLFETTDGGAGWRRSYIADFTTSFSDIVAVDDTTLAAATSHSGGFAWQSTDAGATWHHVPSPAADIVKLAFRGKFGMGVGPSGVAVRTTDGGATWTSAATIGVDRYDMFGLSMGDSLTAFAVGMHGAIYRTKNRGDGWVQLERPQGNSYYYLWSVSFADADHGVAVGDLGAVLHTTDGGKNWDLLESGTWHQLRSVVYLGGKSWLAVGEGGTILRSTVDGGSQLAVLDLGKERRLRSSILRVVPNPAEAAAHFTFVLPTRSFVQLSISSVLGEEIVTLVSEYRSAGEQRVVWDTPDLPDGTYLYRLEVQPADPSAGPSVEAGTVVVCH